MGNPGIIDLRMRWGSEAERLAWEVMRLPVSLLCRLPLRVEILLETLVGEFTGVYEVMMAFFMRTLDGCMFTRAQTRGGVGRLWVVTRELKSKRRLYLTPAFAPCVCHALL